MGYVFQSCSGNEAYTPSPRREEGGGEMKPQRIQRKRTKGWKMPENTVYVGRPTKWGNPFKEDVWGREQALINYRDFLETCIKTGALKPSELKGKNLSCWCSLKHKCHADILLEYVEGRHCI